MSHLVVGTTQLEAEDGLEVLALEQHIAFQPIAQVGGMGERRLGDDLVDARGENEAKILACSLESMHGITGSLYIHRDVRLAAKRPLELRDAGAIPTAGSDSPCTRSRRGLSSWASAERRHHSIQSIRSQALPGANNPP